MDEGEYLQDTCSITKSNKMHIYFCKDVNDDIFERTMYKLIHSKEHAVLKKYMTWEMFKFMQDRCTPWGSTLLDVVRTGLVRPQAEVCACAPDADAYDIFRELFDVLVSDLQTTRSFIHPKQCWGNWTQLDRIDPSGRYVLSTRIKCSRNLKEHRFTPTMTPSEFQEVEHVIVKTLNTLPAEFCGRYVPLCQLESLGENLNNCFFHEDIKDPRSACITRYWPTGRGIFGNKSGSFGVWVNEKDHICVCSFGAGDDLPKAYRRLVSIMEILDSELEPVRCWRRGYLTVSPALLGNGLRFSANVRLPHLFPNDIIDFSQKYNVEARVIKSCCYCLSNKLNFGLTEYQQALQFINSIQEVIKFEKKHDPLYSPKLYSRPPSPKNKMKKKNYESSPDKIRRPIKASSARKIQSGGSRPGSKTGTTRQTKSSSLTLATIHRLLS